MTTLPTAHELGSLDVSIGISSLPLNASLIVKTNIDVSSTVTGSHVTLYNTSGSGGIRFETSTSGSPQTFIYETIPSKIRVLYHGHFCSIYCDDKWVHTFTTMYCYYPDDITVSLRASGSAVGVSSTSIEELDDWREAIFIDLESTAQNAISSVIQQRPVDVYSRYDGSINFAYYPAVRDEVSLNEKFVRSFSKRSVDNASVCSDAIAYYSEVGFSIDTNAAEDVGFITRVIRIPELDYGAMKTVRIMQRKAREGLHTYSIGSRMNLALEFNDLSNISGILTGTKTPINEEFIVEGLRYQFAHSQLEMTVQGRDYAPE